MNRDKSTRFDKLINTAKNNKLLAAIILVGVIVTGISQFTTSLITITDKLMDFDTKKVVIDVSVDSHPVDDDDLALAYSSSPQDKGLLVIPEMQYISRLNAGGPITSLDISRLYPIKYPVLDLKILNNGSKTLFFTEAVFEIQESHIESHPLLIISNSAEELMTLPLINVGSGRIRNIKLQFNLASAATIPQFEGSFTYQKDVGDFIKGTRVVLTEALSKEGVDVDFLRSRILEYYTDRHGQNNIKIRTLDGAELIFAEEHYRQRIAKALGPYRDSVVHVFGILSFSEESDNSQALLRVVKFSTIIPLYKEGGHGEAVPPSGMYDVKFQTDRKKYKKRKAISHSIEPGKADRFTFAIAADKSSRHKFNVALKSADGRTFKSKEVDLKMFVPE